MLIQIDSFVNNNNNNNNFNNENINKILNKSQLIISRDLIISWHFFEIISYSFNINYINDIYKFTINDKYGKKYKQKLIHFIQYNKNIVRQYKRNIGQPHSKEYFKSLGNLLLKEENINNNNFKTVPIFIYKNVVVLGIIFINNKINNNLNHKNNYDILYKKIFLININKSITRLNNINIIKGIINTFINREYMKNIITLENNYESILSAKIVIHISLLNLLNIFEKYNEIFEFKT